MVDAVLDASALIAFLRKEPGHEQVAKVITSPSISVISAINLAEVFGKMVEYGKPLDDVEYQVSRLRVPAIHFDVEQARIVASLWKTTREVGLSLGDLVCIALALRVEAPALTTAGDWAKCKLDVKIVKIR